MGIAVCALLFAAMPARAAVTDWQKGVSMYPATADDFSSASFDASLLNAHKAGANTAALIIPMYQSNDQSSDISAGWNTPTDASIISAANYAHSIGMKVVLKPHLDPYNGDWRANISASDRDTWYSKYSSLLNHVGDLGKQTGSEGMVIGTELISMSDYTVNPDNTNRWNTMIASLRQHFSGFLTYSANWGGSDYAEEAPHIGFWGSLDYIGISAYYPLANGQSSPSQDALAGSWNFWDTSKIKVLHDQYNKPIIFTEIGYRSVDNAHDLPWFAGPSGNYNPTEQVNDYQALFNYWNSQPYMNGIYVWNWDTDPNAGGQGNTDFTPQNKPAQGTLLSWFGGSSNSDGGNTTGGNSGGNSSGGASSVSGSWTISATSPALSANQAANIPFTVSISGQATNIIIDAEIYDSFGHQVAQQYFTGQNVSSSQPMNHGVSWTPSSNGSYTLKVGIFKSDWSSMYIWNDSVASLNVGGSSSTGGSTSTGGNTGGSSATALDIWWPTDGSAISGVQPFKGLIENRSLSDYTMYWQVDGDALVQMNNSQADYPHKESDVDVSSWNWKGAGPYAVTFVAKDTSGKVIAQKTVKVTVVN